MGNRSWFNNDPYRSDVNHIPYTHYESTKLYNDNIVFLYGSIAKKCDIFKKSLSDLILDQQAIGTSFGIQYKNEILSDDDIESLILLNRVFEYLLSSHNNYDPEELSRINIDTVEEYLSNSTKDKVPALASPGTVIEVKEIASDIESTYPYELNTLDTGVPTDLYYEIKNISESMIGIIVYAGFFDYLFKNGNVRHFVRHTVLKLHEFMTIQDIARLNLFKLYIKTL